MRNVAILCLASALAALVLSSAARPDLERLRWKPVLLRRCGKDSGARSDPIWTGCAPDLAEPDPSSSGILARELSSDQIASTMDSARVRGPAFRGRCPLKET